MTTSFSLAVSDECTPSEQHSTIPVSPPLSEGVANAGRTELTEQEREAAIYRAGRSVTHHVAEAKKYLMDFDVTNNPLDKILADQHVTKAQFAANLMDSLIKGRKEQE